MTLELLTKIERLYIELKAEKTQAELETIINIGIEMKDKLKEMFALGKDAADDVVDILTLTFAILERISETDTTSRTLFCPPEKIQTFDDIINTVLSINTPASQIEKQGEHKIIR